MKLMKHQLKAVKEIANAFKNSKSVIYTSGVGTGKSYVFFGIAQNVKGKILYIIPKHSITENIKDYPEFTELGLNDKVDFCTFNYFNSAEKGNRIADYDLVVIDECHHIASDLYGNNLLAALYKSNVKVLGLTATPAREDGINVADLFDKEVKGLSNFDAIMDGLMPAIEYLVCSPDANDILGKDKIKIDYYGSYGLLKDAVEHNNKKKWICFFSNIKQLNLMKEMITNLFPEHKIFEIHSNKKNCKAILNKANETEKCIMLNCDMLLEGLHFSNVDGILLFREVHSVPTFEQIIGRVSSMSKKENPLVIDCTETWKRMNAYISLEKENDSKQINNTKQKTNNTPCYVSLKNKKFYDYMEYLAKKCCKDEFSYNGIQYNSVAECCRQYGIEPGRELNCKNRKQFSTHEETIDYLINSETYYDGKLWNSIKEICNYYGINNLTVQHDHRDKGMKYSDAIDMRRKMKPRFEYSYNGKTYSSFKNCCESYGISYRSAQEYVNRGMTREDAIQKCIGNTFTYNGKQYKSVADCLRNFGINKSAYDFKRSKGYSATEAISILRKEK